MAAVRDIATELSQSRDVKTIELDKKFTSQHNDKSMREVQNWAKDKARSKTVMVVAYTR